MVLYFTGTGNSRYIAERIAEALGDELCSMNDRIKAGDTSPVISDERLLFRVFWHRLSSAAGDSVRFCQVCNLCGHEWPHDSE